jgi:hypothetical protein
MGRAERPNYRLNIRKLLIFKRVRQVNSAGARSDIV